MLKNGVSLWTVSDFISEPCDINNQQFLDFNDKIKKIMEKKTRDRLFFSTSGVTVMAAPITL